MAISTLNDRKTLVKNQSLGSKFTRMKVASPKSGLPVVVGVPTGSSSWGNSIGKLDFMK